jgi:hypothetical protein
VKYCLCGLVFISVIFFAVACHPLQNPSEETMEPNQYTVNANTQIRVGDLRIGMGNLRVAEYIDDAGETTTGMTASLAISVRNDPVASQQIRVHTGQKITIGKYFLQVIEVSSETRSVTLIVNELLPTLSVP